MKSWFIQGSWHELQLLRKSSYWRASDATLQDSSSWDLYEVKRENSLQFCFVFFKNGSRYLSEQLERKKENCHCFFLSQRWLLNEFLREHRSFNMNYWCQSMIFFFFFFWITVLNIDFYSFSVFFFLFFLMKCYTPVFNCK